LANVPNIFPHRSALRPFFASLYSTPRSDPFWHSSAIRPILASPLGAPPSFRRSTAPFFRNRTWMGMGKTSKSQEKIRKIGAPAPTYFTLFTILALRAPPHFPKSPHCSPHPLLPTPCLFTQPCLDWPNFDVNNRNKVLLLLHYANTCSVVFNERVGWLSHWAMDQLIPADAQVNQ
jgi:hypothetical protein